ncbi:hypothetical protein SXCC_03120 [Gluconacetobacter sp. SXCC-1]|nr:hypothetical protein SXCC_03120 [Gluconacetobacter sp. SXCC-1]
MEWIMRAICFSPVTHARAHDNTPPNRALFHLYCLAHP